MRYEDLMKKDGYCDLHVHTNRSDAMSIWTPEKVILRAKSMGITHLALTDHNITNPDYLEQSEQHRIDVISSAEFSANEIIDGVLCEIHIIAYRIDPNNPIIMDLVNRAHQNRDEYLKAMLHGLELEGIIITLEELKERNSKSLHIGRVALGELLIERGYAKNMREVYDKYLGKESGSPAYVPSNRFLKYPPLRDVVFAIVAAGGIPILAHVPYYGLDGIREYKLLKRFQYCARHRGSMETEYGDYPPYVVMRQKELAKLFWFVESTGSDFHGYEGLDLKLGSNVIYQQVQNHWENVHL